MIFYRPKCEWLSSQPKPKGKPNLNLPGGFPKATHSLLVDQGSAPPFSDRGPQTLPHPSPFHTSLLPGAKVTPPPPLVVLPAVWAPEAGGDAPADAAGGDHGPQVPRGHLPRGPQGDLQDRPGVLAVAGVCVDVHLRVYPPPRHPRTPPFFRPHDFYGMLISLLLVSIPRL